MKKIHLNRDRQNLGEFTPEEVLQGLQEGKFLPTDLAWHVGMDAWRPLGDIRDSLAGEGPLPTSTPLEPREAQSQDLLAPGTSLQPSGQEPKPSWERRQELGLFPSLIESIQQILTQPAETFSQMPRSGGFATPLIFTIILSLLGVVAVSIYQGIWLMVNPEAVEQELQGFPLSTFWIFVALVIIVMPVILIVTSFIGSGIVHLFLMLTGGAKHSFETTFRVNCYCQGAASVLQLIPLCGGVISSVWYLVSLIIGLTKAHETESWRVVVAVLLPGILCCGAILLLMGLVGFAAVGEAVGNK